MIQGKHTYHITASNGEHIKTVQADDLYTEDNVSALVANDPDDEDNSPVTVCTVPHASGCIVLRVS